MTAKHHQRFFKDQHIQEGKPNMFFSIRKRITYANVLLTFALVFAMTGGAFAAGKYLITSTKQISPKVLKSLQGKTGPAGKNGANGAAGPAGPTGPQGPAGTKGENGKEGTAGKDGVSVTSASASSGECKAGGVKLTSVSGTTAVCNGEKGAKGEPGKNGTFGGEPLPAGKTLTGTYASSGFAEAVYPEPGFGIVSAAVSFPVPVANIQASHVQYIDQGVTEATGTGDLEKESDQVENVTTTTGTFTVGATISGAGIPANTKITAVTEVSGKMTLTLSSEATVTGPVTGVALTAGLPAGCKGSLNEPGAEEGYLCVFAESEYNLDVPASPSLSGTSLASIGFIVQGYSGGKGAMVISGTWVVTGD